MGGTYSNFADGMSAVDDRARYIVNNNTKFFEGFSARAKAAGLNNTRISEAYNAMKSRDRTKMASYFDTSSPKNGAEEAENILKTTGEFKKGFETRHANQYCLSGQDHFEAYKEMFGEENVEWVTRPVETPDYVKLSNDLESKLTSDGYVILDTETAEKANTDWFRKGYTNPPIAENTTVYHVQAGNHKYARVYCSTSKSRPKSPFILRAEDIEGLTREQIAEKYALPQIPDKIVYPQIPPDTPLEISIVGPQEFNGIRTLGGDAQYSIKLVTPKDEWFLPFIEDLK